MPLSYDHFFRIDLGITFIDVNIKKHGANEGATRKGWKMQGSKVIIIPFLGNIKELHSMPFGYKNASGK